MNRNMAFSAVMAALGLIPLAAAAQAAPDLRAAAYLAANCANCHGTAGRATSALPGLAGMPKDGFISAMAEFRDGKRRSTVMRQLAKGYTDEQIALMSEYFSRQSGQ